MGTLLSLMRMGSGDVFFKKDSPEAEKAGRV